MRGEMGRPGGTWRSNRPARVRRRRTRASWKSVQIGRSTALTWRGPQLDLSEPLQKGALRPQLGQEGRDGATRWYLALESACEGPVAAYAGEVPTLQDYFSGYAIFWGGMSVGFSNLFCGYRWGQGGGRERARVVSLSRQHACIACACCALGGASPNTRTHAHTHTHALASAGSASASRGRAAPWQTPRCRRSLSL